MTGQRNPRGTTALRDRGSILVLTLVLSLVMSMVVMGLARYVTTALRASRVTDRRSEASAASTAAIQWELEELTHKRVVPCASVLSIQLPSGLVPMGSTTTLTCTPAAKLNGHPVVVLQARTVSEAQTVAMTARVQVPVQSYEVRVLGWSVEPTAT